MLGHLFHHNVCGYAKYNHKEILSIKGKQQNNTHSSKKRCNRHTKYVSADKYKDLEKQLGKVNSALTEKTTEYDTLKEKAGDNAELKAEIERLKAENTNTVNSLKADYEKQLKRSTVINEIQNKYHPKDVNDIIPHIDMEKISVENDNIVGLTEQITPLTESKAYLFGNEPQRNKSGLKHDDKDYDTARLEAAFGITKKE